MSLKRIKLKIAYDGTDYCGWQKQKNIATASVQGTLEQALARILDQEIKTIGSGRTDAGVHAFGQIVHFDTDRDMSRYQLVRGLNSLLPKSISVHEAWLAPEEFHALHSAECKSYVYYIHNRPQASALRARYSLWESKALNLQWLNQCSQFLVKKQDFKSFQNTGVILKTTVREVYEAHWSLENGLVAFHITGNGFLKQMVRNIVGTQLGLFGRGEKPESIQAIIEACDRSAALKTAAPQGLYLKWVKYPAKLDNKCRKL